MTATVKAGFLKCLACLLLALPGLRGDWKDSLTPDVPGPFSAIRSFEAEFRIGWTDIEAGHARTKVTNIGGDLIQLEAGGGTTGLARMLWQLDGSLKGTTARSGLRTISSEMKESYATRTIDTQIVARPDGIWRIRESNPPGENAARWKRVKIAPLRDLFSGLLFLRSQHLTPGQSVSTIIFPGDAPFLVELKTLGTGPLTIAGTAHDTIRLDMNIQRINLKKDDCLEPQKKFRKGTVWLSNDEDRIPLRVELELFIGYVFAELESVSFNPR